MGSYFQIKLLIKQEIKKIRDKMIKIALKLISKECAKKSNHFNISKWSFFIRGNIKVDINNKESISL